MASAPSRNSANKQRRIKKIDRAGVPRGERATRSASIPVLWAATMLASASSCANAGKFIWVDEYSPSAATAPRPYVIGVGDVIKVTVFNHDQLTQRVRVREDGKVTLPLLGDVVAAGYTPSDLAQILEKRLAELVKSPSVTVSVEEVKPQTFMVMGEVARPDSYTLEPGMGVLQALALAGGLTADASGDRIFVLRQDPSPVRIRFTYERLIHQSGQAVTFQLRAGDVVVVE